MNEQVGVRRFQTGHRRATIALHAAMFIAAPGIVSAQPPDNETPSLAQLVQEYFAAEPAEKRDVLVPRIAEAATGSIPDVLAALRAVQVWTAADPRAASTVPTEANGQTTAFDVRLPTGYDSAKAHPVAIVLTAADKPVDHDPIVQAISRLDEPFVVIVPRAAPPSSFHASERGTDEVRAWLVAVRRRFHVDGDRVYLYGAAAGADAALTLILTQPDVFAGAIINEGAFDGPYGRELLPLLLPNVRHTPLRLIWTEPLMPVGELLVGRDYDVALTGMIVRETAARLDLPITETVLRPGEVPDYSFLNDWMTRRRPRVADTARQFRFPAQGRSHFVRAIDLPPGAPGDAHSPWQGDQLHILTVGHTDPSAYVTSVLDSKLPKFTARIEGQSIDIRSTLCDAIELHLPAGVVDFDKPVAIHHNGIRVFDGRLKPDVKTLLDSAYLEWEFQHPAVVRLRITARGTAVPF
ncbi:MAG: hypothetical protein HOP29_16105 [Phycisphaerales bacterium]|nr:hypothetical protein [Phycisphaerales bacterium]